MRLPREGSQLEALILAVRQELQRRITEAESKGEVPDQASILIETRAVVVFGGPLRRGMMKDKWVKGQSAKMPEDLAKQFRRQGAAHSVQMVEQGLHVHTIQEMVDVHMTPEAAKRMAEAQRLAAAEKVEGGTTNENPSI